MVLENSEVSKRIDLQAKHLDPEKREKTVEVIQMNEFLFPDAPRRTNRIAHNV